MTIVKQIEEDLLNARKERDPVKVPLLSTLLSEVKTVGKNAGNRETTDPETIALVKKFINNMDSVLALEKVNPETKAQLIAEKEAISVYLPKQLSREELKTALSQFQLQNPHARMKEVMTYLKETFPGQYDGGMATAIVKEIW